MDELLELPVAKRQRRNELNKPNSIPPSSSRLFAPFRVLGLVSPTNVPFTSVALGKTTFQITTSVGTSLQTYDLRRGLSLVFISQPPTPRVITATCAYRDRVFVAWGGLQPTEPRGVSIFKRGKLVGELDVEATQPQEISQILVFGPWVIGCGAQAIEVWKHDSHEHYTTITPSTKSNSTLATGVLTGRFCTLPTLLNKIFVGRCDGLVEVYNVSTGRLIHTILSPISTSGSVTALTPAPALGLLAVAYADGSVVIFDVEADESVLNLQQRTNSKPVTSISFRSDGLGGGEDGRKDGVMATASTESGDITLWDLNRGGKVVGVLRGAHEISKTSAGAGITGIDFLPGQPVIISTGRDNALRSWVFDQAPFSPVPRLLHRRGGHASSITKLQFLPTASDGSDAAGKWLLSAAQDRSLWGFSLRKDAQNTELSQGAINSKARKTGLLTDDAAAVEDFKASPIIDIACSLNRDGGMGTVNGPVWTNTKTSNAEEVGMTGWESVITAHAEDCFARTWSWGRKKAGRWAFETGDHRPVTSVAITACGTFAVVGSAGGSLNMFNLQSGAHRQRYPPRLMPAQVKQAKLRQQTDPSTTSARGHQDAITGIAIDNLNDTMVTSSLDGSIIFWDFITGNFQEQKQLETTVPTAIRYNTVSGLIALSCDDLCIRILDIETRKIVRELWGCVGQIYDFCFSHDGHWIVACSMDSVVRVFDLATGHLIDAFRTATCTNVAFSSTGEFLATTHVGSTGVNIWTNKALFAHLPTRQVDESDGVIDLSATAEFQAASQLALDNHDSTDEALSAGTDAGTDLDQIHKSLLTLSIVPKTRWQTLLNLDLVRQRNKPLQPAEKPKAAPFFLGSSSTNNGILNRGEQDQVVEESERSRISRLAMTSHNTQQSQVSGLLRKFGSNATQDPTFVSEYLAALPPSAADLEIRSLILEEMPLFVRALTQQLRLRKYFELVNTWMNVFLRLHGDFVTEVPDLKIAVSEWRQEMESEEKRLNQLVGFTRGVVDFLRSAR